MHIAMHASLNRSNMRESNPIYGNMYRVMRGERIRIRVENEL